MSSSAKQRLWATCLGIAVSAETTAEQVAAAIDDYQTGKQWKSKATRGQKRLAKQMGVDISGAANRREVAGVLYEAGLLYGWVFSVWRRETQRKGRWYSELGLPANPAMDIAVELYQAGHASEVKAYSTTDSHSGDVFFHLRGKAATGAAYQAAVSQLSTKLKGLSSQCSQSAAADPSRTKQTAAPSGSGCGLLVFGLVTLWLITALIRPDADEVQKTSVDSAELANEHPEPTRSHREENQREVEVGEAPRESVNVAVQKKTATEVKPPKSEVLFVDSDDADTNAADDKGKAAIRRLIAASEADKPRQEKVYDEKALKAAGSRIALTTQLIQGGKAGEPEAKWMRAVIADFPDTEIATQAAELLKQIPE